MGNASTGLESIRANGLQFYNKKLFLLFFFFPPETLIVHKSSNLMFTYSRICILFFSIPFHKEILYKVLVNSKVRPTMRFSKVFFEVTKEY